MVLDALRAVTSKPLAKTNIASIANLSSSKVNEILSLLKSCGLVIVDETSYGGWRHTNGLVHITDKGIDFLRSDNKIHIALVDKTQQLRVICDFIDTCGFRSNRQCQECWNREREKRREQQIKQMD